MAEWLIEGGIGETRAALVDAGTILIGAIERPGGLRAGAVVEARYLRPAIGTRAAWVRTEAGEAFLDPVPAGAGPGAKLRVEVAREAIGAKRPRVIAAAGDMPVRDAPALIDRLAATGVPVRPVPAFGDDLMEHAGWSELIEEVLTGEVVFAGGRLLVEQTAAFVTIDVDGDLAPADLAIAAAGATARAIARLDLAGAIVIDLPTTADRASRLRTAEAFDAAMPVLAGPFERTAVNGWGLLQVIRPRRRASLVELIRADQPRAAMLALLRRAEREPPGPLVLTTAPRLFAAEDRARAQEELARRRGGTVTWRTDDALPIWRGYAHVQRD